MTAPLRVAFVSLITTAAAASAAAPADAPAAPANVPAAPGGPKPRLEELRALSRPALAERLRGTSPEDLLALGREGVRALGAYRARVVKQERVGGELLPPQTIEVSVRTAPRALRLEYVAGPKQGRRLVWRGDVRPSEMLVREAGILGLASVWIDVDGKMARKDTNHRVSDLGFGPALDLFDSDLRKGRAQGGHARRDRGFDDRGRYCLEYAAPPGARGLYAERTTICLDPRFAVPVLIEVFDRQGLLERYDYADVRPQQKLEPSLFESV